MLTGALAGVGGVVAVGILGPAIPLPVRGAILGALTGVLLAPFLAIGSFLSMLMSPFSLGGILGDSAWSRMARALHEHTYRPLVVPLLVFVMLPMALCGLGGARMKEVSPVFLVSAGLGAALLGAILGSVFGARAGSSDNPSLPRG
jgi:hypothetical protein